jgi:hypothetical protein
LVTTYSDIVAFLKSSKTDTTIRLALIAIGVEPEYRSISRPLFGWGPKGEPNALIVAESKMVDLLRQLKSIWQSHSSMITIRVESEYRTVARSLSGWGPEGEVNPRSPLGARS